MAAIQLEVATPERLLLKEEVSDVQLPGANGELGILPEHAPLLSELGAGPLRYTLVGQGTRYLSVSGGWVEVRPDAVRVLASTAELAADIDVNRAQESLKRANDRILKPTADVDVARALNAAKRAQARIDAARLSGVK